jgi:hypothetical protein
VNQISTAAWVHTIINAGRKNRSGIVVRSHGYQEEEPRLVELMKLYGFHVIKLERDYVFVCSKGQFKVLC